MRKPFDLETYRAHPEMRVELGIIDPWPVRIVCDDLNGDDLIVIVKNPNGKEEALIYTKEGKHKAYCPKIDSDLFIVTDEPELNEFQQNLKSICDACIKAPCVDTTEVAIVESKKLLSLAREQLIHEGYIIEKKTFHDAVENVESEVTKEVKENVDRVNGGLTKFEEAVDNVIRSYRCDSEKDENGITLNYQDWIKKMSAELFEIARKELIGETLTSDPKETALYKAGVLDGKAEALKGLPKWRVAYTIVGKSTEEYVTYSTVHKALIVLPEGSGTAKTIMLDDLKKLPGFNEE